jgi:hypothetical protein
MLDYLRWPIGLVLLVANIGVIAGVYLEDDKFSEHIKRMGWKLLLVSLAIEAADGFALFSIDTSLTNDQSKQIAQLQLDTADATKSAAEFAKEAQQLKIDLLNEQHKRESRHVTDEQLSTLVSGLSKVGGPFFLVCRDEDEPRKYCDQFAIALVKAGLIDPNVAPNIFTDMPMSSVTGIKLYAPTVTDKNDLASDPFLKAFDNAHIPVTGVCSGSASCYFPAVSPGSILMGVGVGAGNNLSGNGIVLDPRIIRPMRTIYIGQKPLQD